MFKNVIKESVFLNEGCNAIQPSTYRKLMCDKIKSGDNIVQIEAEYKQEVLKDNSKKVKFMLTPDHVYNVLKRITRFRLRYSWF